jgi:hypothetical protein
VKDYKIILVEECKHFASHLLQQCGEFFPFAYGIVKANETVVSVVDEDIDHRDSLDVIDRLENAFRQLHAEHQFLAVCICVDVSVTLHESQEKFDALEVRVDIQGSEPKNCYVPYTLIDGDLHEEECYEREGSLIFF